VADVSTVRTTALASSRWTPTLIAERLEEAADVLSRLPDRGAGGFYDLWPRLVGAADAAPIQAAPAPEAIDRMDEALRWLCWLEPEERRLVWVRAEGLPWKRITHRLGIGRTTAWQRWTTALLKISVRLNAADEQRRLNTKAMNKRGGFVLKRI
jgi:Domain of unknown function (DUF6362)